MGCSLRLHAPTRTTLYSSYPSIDRAFYIDLHQLSCNAANSKPIVWTRTANIARPCNKTGRLRRAPNLLSPTYRFPAPRYGRHKSPLHHTQQCFVRRTQGQIFLRLACLQFSTTTCRDLSSTATNSSHYGSVKISMVGKPWTYHGVWEAPGGGLGERG